MNMDISGIIANIERNLTNVQSANAKIEAAAKAHVSLSTQVAAYVASLKQLEELTEKLCRVAGQEREVEVAALSVATDKCVKASGSLADGATKVLARMAEMADGRMMADAEASAHLKDACAEASTLFKDACDGASAIFSQQLDKATASYEDKLVQMTVTLEEDRAENKTNFDMQLAALQAKLTAFQSTARSLVDAIGIVSQLDGDILRLKEDNEAQKNSTEEWRNDMRRNVASEFDAVRSDVRGSSLSLEGEVRQFKDRILKNAKSIELKQDENAKRLTMLARDLRGVKVFIYVLLALSAVILTRLFIM